ncbi:MAG: DUF2807 domain-containing protein [Salinivirgaceae bacterium]|jgi:hypothetical protein|nr:DUF2807 domain-containing protein [Salinivirgaceae bacterium]
MKTLKIIAVFIAFSLTTQIFAQEKTERRNVTGFSGVDVSEGIKVELTYGEKEFVEVTADEEYIDRIVTKLNGEELDIYVKGNNWNSWNKNILVKVTATKINKIKVSSGANVVSQNLIESEALKMSLNSGAHMKIAFKAPKASCEASSGANATLKGSAKVFKADASSGAGINASEVKAVSVNADVSSGAHISVHAEEEIEADASSGGSIKYTGSPKMVDVDKSSGGSVRKKD